MFKAMFPIVSPFGRVLKSRRGQALVEYTLILSFVSLLSVVVMSIMGVQIHGLYSSLINGLAMVRSSI